jgi:uncharacterized repeat protein (TIGR02543 family)
MYRKLKNILGVSLMIMAVIISQIPMPNAQAEIAGESVAEVSDSGFALSEDRTILYKYEGNSIYVKIPDSVKIIKKDAFASLGEVRGITLSENLETVENGAFSGLTGANIIYIYDAGNENTKKLAGQLSEEYEQLVYSEYLDIDKVEKIAGIDYGITTVTETAETAQAQESSVTEPEVEYKVVFDTGLSDVSGETRTVLAGRTTSELVSIDQNQPKILKKDSYKIEKDDGKQITTYTFKGWYKDKEFTKEWNFANDIVEGDTTIYAKWDTDVNVYYEEKTYTVVFQMNGGKFTGQYNKSAYTDATSLKLEVVEGNGISDTEYPDSDSSAVFKYSNYKTDSSWYTDKECLKTYTEKDSSGNDTVVKKNLTLYKKWYYTSSGVTLNAAGNVLYKYSAGTENVVIPESVTVIGNDAFSNLTGISSITLPDNISDIRSNAFSGADKLTSDIVITGNTEASITKAKELADKYTHLVYKDMTTSAETLESEQTAESDTSAVSVVKSGDIKLGATISGNVVSSTPSTGTSATGNSENTVSSTTGTSPSTVYYGINTSGISSSAQVTTAEKPNQSTSSAATTSVSTVTSESAAKSTQHVKDSTPKTGDTVQYRMLLVYVMFSFGLLIVLTGNGKKKKFSPSLQYPKE